MATWSAYRTGAGVRNCRLLLNGCRSWRAEARREFLIVDAVAVGQVAGRHVERAKDEIENRERGGEILLAAAIGGGVVPAVEDRRRNHVFERAERPVEVGMHESRMGDGDRSEYDENVGRDAGKQQHTSANTEPKKRLTG